MRTQGRITFWNDKKGYGFIRPDSGKERVFVHIRAFSHHIERPDLNEKVSYSLSTNKQGRPCAAKVVSVGEKPPRKTKRNNYSGNVLIALIFMSAVGMSVLISGMPVQVLFAYLAASVIAFVVYAIDKSAARRGAWRTKESTLHLLSLIGGWPGALIAQQLLRHKSKKENFRTIFWVTVIINCCAFVWLFTADGSAFLRSVITEAGRMVSA